ncbi:uncharacterized protein METZ01_LOCUS503827, partial [marine metagenome]
MWGWDGVGGFYLITISSVLFSHIIFNTRWIWGTELIIVNVEINRTTPINIQITDTLRYYSYELIIIQDQINQIGQIPYP